MSLSLGTTAKFTIGIMAFNVAVVVLFGLSLIEEYKDKKAPAEDYMTIEYIKASDVVNSTQKMEMCRWVDKERTGTWTWELTSVEEGRVYSASQGAIIEVIDDCILKWTLTNLPSLNQKPGVYYWSTIVEFDVNGYKKSLSARSNNFSI